MGELSKHPPLRYIHTSEFESEDFMINRIELSHLYHLGGGRVAKSKKLNTCCT